MTARLVFVAILSFAAGTGHGQSCRTAARFINNKAELLDTMKCNAAKRLVSLRSVAPSIAVDLVYATPNNFTRTVLYKNPIACLRAGPAEDLRRAQEELSRKGLGLKVYDAFRPFSATCKMWRVVPDRRYAANPMKGSNHNRGLAVDITLVNLQTGRELDMGTGFDNFTDTAHHSFLHLPYPVLANRKLLKQIMRKHGFSGVPTEWWHYTWRTKEQYEVIDIDFDELQDLIAGR